MMGLEYSPSIESSFREVYAKIATSGGRSLGGADPLTKPLVSSKYLSLFHTDLSASPFAMEALSYSDEEDGDEAVDDVGRCCYIFG